MHFEFDSHLVIRWSSDPFAKGSWSQLLVNGSSSDRIALAEPIGRLVALAGEACNHISPAMVHGAYASGQRAGQWALNEIETEDLIAIIGAGAAGIACAKYLRESRHSNVIILEAKDHIGGRAHSVFMEAIPLNNTNKERSPYRINVGANWMQQFSINPLVAVAEGMKLTLVPSEFNNPLGATQSGTVDSAKICDSLDEIVTELNAATESNGCDVSVLQVMLQSDHFKQLSAEDRHYCHLALADVLADSGCNLRDLSASNGLSEPGVGDNDHYIREGYAELFERLSIDLDVRFHSIVQTINWESPQFVEITLASGHVMKCKKCVSTVPISLLQDGSVQFCPPLPVKHRDALSRLELGVCNKVVLKYKSRWWPQSPGGIMRWYGDLKPGDDLEKAISCFNYVDWLDLTDTTGEAIVMGFIAGSEAIDKFMTGRTDEEVAWLAAAEFGRWAAAVTSARGGGDV